MSNAQSRCLAPSVAKSPTVVNGRSYVCSPGNTVDVVLSDANGLAANGWLMLGQVGPTTSRPTDSSDINKRYPGCIFIDTTLAEMIVFDGLTWRDISGALV